MIVTVEGILNEVNRPIVLAQATEGKMLLRLIYFPEKKLYEVDCIKNGVAVEDYAYSGKIAHNAVLKYNEAYQLEIVNENIKIHK